jgi:hypothetical protein
LAVQIQIDQSEVGAQPVMILGDAPVAHVVEAEDAPSEREISPLDTPKEKRKA